MANKNYTFISHAVVVSYFRKKIEKKMITKNKFIFTPNDSSNKKCVETIFKVKLGFTKA